MIKDIHPKDLWYEWKDQIIGRTAIIHSGSTAEMLEPFEFVELTFDPPLTVNNFRMQEKMHMTVLLGPDTMGEYLTDVAEILNCHGRTC